MKTSELPFKFHTRSRRADGRSTMVGDCPFCGEANLVYLWSFAGHGKKKCICGAILYRDGIARKKTD